MGTKEGFKVQSSAYIEIIELHTIMYIHKDTSYSFQNLQCCLVQSDNMI